MNIIKKLTNLILLCTFFNTVGISQNTTVIPINDDCSGAIELTPSSVCTATNGSTQDATQSLAGCTGTADDDVWYKFVATATSHSIKVKGSTDFDAVLQVFSGTCGSTSSLYCVDNNFAKGGTEQINATGLTIGTTYLIRVYDYFNPGAPLTNPTFEICVFDAPTPTQNDDCTNAINLSVGTTCNPINGTTMNATQSQAGCSGTANDDVWFKFTATNTSEVIKVIGSSAFDAVIQLFSGNCSNTSSLYCVDNDVNGGGTEKITATGLTLGQTYFIRVYDYSTANLSDPTFTICVYDAPPAPVNDSCNTATIITPTVTCTPTSGTTLGATGPSTGCSGNADDDVWYKFVATKTRYSIAVQGGADFDAVLELSAGCGTTNLICKNATTNAGIETVDATALTIGNTYYLRTYHAGVGESTTPNFTVCVYDMPPTPINDSCTGAITLTPASTCTSITGTTAYATESLPGCKGTAEEDVWFKFTASSNQQAVKVLGSSGFDAVVEVFTGCNNGKSLSCTDVSYVKGGTELTKIGSLTIGQTYYVRVYDYYNTQPTTPTFDICVYDLPPTPTNDDCIGAVTIPMVKDFAACNSAAVSTLLATPSTNPATCISTSFVDDVWHKFNATAKHAIIKSTAKSVTNSSIGYIVYADSCSGAVVKCNGSNTNDSMLVGGLTIGSTYFIRSFYGGGTATVGTYNLCVYETVSPASVNNSIDENSINIYPNPAKDELNLSVNQLQSAGLIRIINLNGQVVYQTTISANSNTLTIPVQNQNAGIYTIQIVTDNTVVNKRFSIVH